MRKFIKLTVLLTVFLTLSPMTRGEIKISPDSIMIDGGDSTPQWVYVNKYNRFFWTNDKQNFLKIDLTKAEKTCLSGSKDCINFYDNDKGIYGDIFVAGTNIMSDSCAKSNIRHLENNILNELRPVSFKWSNPDKNNVAWIAASQDSGTDNTHFGFIAQEIAEIIPEAVKEDDFGNYLVNYNALIPVLIKALQELDKQIDTQSEQLDDLTIEAGLYIYK